MVVSILLILITIPRLFREITEVINSPVKPQFATVTALISRTRHLRRSLEDWYSSNVGPDQEPKKRLCNGFPKILVLFYVCSIYANRLNTCLYWTGTPYIADAEEETQRYANILLDLERQEAYTNLQGALLLAQKVPMAKATITTGQEWKTMLSRTPSVPLFRMPQATFNRWCHLFGRKTT